MNFKRKLWWAQHKEQIFRIYAITLTLVLVILGIIYFSYSKFSSSNEMTMYETTVEPFIKNDYFIASYIDGEWSDSIPGKNDGYEVDKIVCDNDAVGTWDSETWSINISNATKKIKCSIYFKLTTVFDFDYTGTEQVFTAPKTGTYKIETWGAQGGNSSVNAYYGGYGSYSIGNIFLEENKDLYINAGGQGASACLKSICVGGYNGGGNSGAYMDDNRNWNAGGGGATHIATKSGLLNTLENYKDKIIIVSGGGGGATNRMNDGILGGHAGGIIGSSSVSTDTGCSYLGTGGNQTLGGKMYDCKSLYSNAIDGSFGQGGTYMNTIENYNSSGGGSGYYGGSFAGGGGSGYIGNSLLTNKAMYCYNCEESSEESTKTISTTCAEETPTENCAKKGNGYARITYIGNDK